MSNSTLNRDAQLSTLSKAAYLDNPPSHIGDWTLVRDSGPSSTGFFAVAYVNNSSKEVAVSIRGTDGASDLRVDTTFKTGAWNPQFTAAAKFTASIKAQMAAESGFNDPTSGRYELITTGHSLGGGIAQIIAYMFGLSGSTYEAPGALAVADNALFRIVQAQYAQDGGGKLSSDVINYRVEGSVISSIGTPIGLQISLGSLNQAGISVFIGTAVMMSSVALGGLGAPLALAFGFGSVNVGSLHSITGIENAITIAAGIQKALGNGELKMTTVSVSQATGQRWMDTGVEPRVTVFKDARDKITAYIQQEGSGWKLSTPDQKTVITLVPSTVPGQAPLCTVVQNDKIYSCIETKDNITTVSTVSDNNGKLSKINIVVDTNFDGKLEKYVTTGTTQAELLSADIQIQNLYNQGRLGADLWNNYAGWSTGQLVNSNTFTSVLNNASLDLSPIGAFYESKSAGYDAATSIAYKTFRVLTSAGVGLTAAQLAALDTNADGKVSGTELNGLSAWRDVNEDGVLNRSLYEYELSGLTASLAAVGLTSIRASDYGFYTAGNVADRSDMQNFAAAPANARVAPVSAVSNYSTLRNTDNRFVINGIGWIDWKASEIKLSSNQLNIVGTENDDIFDLRYFSKYDGTFFNLNLVQNFYGGGGNDMVGGTVRNDSIWGGTGNDSLFGFAGDDKLYGEEGNDELQGGVGKAFLMVEWATTNSSARSATTR